MGNEKNGRLGNGFSEQWFLSRGYVKNSQGGYDPPPFKHKVFKPEEEVIVKEKVNNSPDFTHKAICEWFIPYQIPSKKNSRQVFVHPHTKRMVNIPSKAYTEYINATKMYWEAFGREFKNTIESERLKFPLKIHMTFIRKTKQRVDYFGPGESVFDLMTDFRWWPDDNHLYGKPFFGDIEVDKNNPGVRIKILV